MLAKCYLLGLREHDDAVSRKYRQFLPRHRSKPWVQFHLDFGSHCTSLYFRWFRLLWHYLVLRRELTAYLSLCG